MSSTQDISLSVHSVARATGPVECRVTQHKHLPPMVQVLIGETSLFLDARDARVVAQKILSVISGEMAA